jgi:hypothetical protein
MNAVITLPARGQSISELQGYFELARGALEALPGGFEVRERGDRFSKCELFANRLLRAPASTVTEILFKFQAAEWLGQDPRQTLAIIRGDLRRIEATEP